MASFPGRIPVYKIPGTPNKKQSPNFWRNRLAEVSDSLGFTVVKPEEDKNYIYNQEGPLHLQIFKASNTFLFYNRDLVGRTVQDKEIMHPKTAKNLSIELLKRNKLLYNGGGTAFQTYYGGDGYTMAQTAAAGQDAYGDWKVEAESEPFKTEIRSHFGYLINGLKVFGPGAKTIVSYVGSELSELMHFWRSPGEPVSDLEIIAPETAIGRLCKESRFVKVMKMNKKHPGLSSGRFYDDVELGYYAVPPVNGQRYYAPVYKIRGTFEARINGFQAKGSNIDQVENNFRHDFVHFVPALHGESAAVQTTNLKKQIIF